MKTSISQRLRRALGFSRSEWARVLNVHDRTVRRWEADDVDPGGTATAAMRGIEMAIDQEMSAEVVRRRLELGGVQGAVLSGLLARRSP